MSSNPAIEVRGLFKYYQIFDRPVHRLWQMILRGRKNFFREHRVLVDISFSIAAGETVGIIGRNGSGKSTLLQIVCGTLEATMGSCEVNGRVAALLELGAGFNPEFTGQENIYMSGQILGLTTGEIDSRYDSIVAFADIGDYVDQPVKTYSSGMFMRLAFAVIAHVDADVLIIDEALAVGDAYFVQKCMRFLQRFRDAGGTLLFVSHDSTTVTGLCDRAIWLHEGRIRIDGSPKDVMQAYLADLYRHEQGDDKVSAHIALQSDSMLHSEADEDFVDARRSLVLASNLRNDLEVMRFDPGRESFGKGGAHIDGVQLLNLQGEPLMWSVGGEAVSLVVSLRTHQVIENLIVGFIVRNKQGLSLFGDNTYLSYLEHGVSCEESQDWVARFDFRMPILPAGEYAVSVAVSDGSQRDHIVHQWVHDALIITSHSSQISTGLVGIPMRRIELTRIIKNS